MVGMNKKCLGRTRDGSELDIDTVVIKRRMYADVTKTNIPAVCVIDLQMRDVASVLCKFQIDFLSEMNMRKSGLDGNTEEGGREEEEVCVGEWTFLQI